MRPDSEAATQVLVRKLFFFLQPSGAVLPRTLFYYLGDHLPAHGFVALPFWRLGRGIPNQLEATSAVLRARHIFLEIMWISSRFCCSQRAHSGKIRSTSPQGGPVRGVVANT